MENKVVIVGAGISARIAKFFYPESLVIAPTITHNPFFYLWKTRDTLKFVLQFKLNFVEKTLENGRIGYNVEKYNVLTYKSLDNKPSKGLSKIKVLLIKDEKWDDIKIDYHNKVVSINTRLKTVTLDSGKKIKFKRLIWTAPINFKLDGKLYKAKYSPISFIKYYSDRELFSADYYYTFLDSFLNVGIYRVSKSSNYYIFEVARSRENLEKAKAFIAKVFPELEYESVYTYHAGHIVSGVRLPEYKDILYLGRNAQMRRKVMAHDVISKLYREVSK